MMGINVRKFFLMLVVPAVIVLGSFQAFAAVRNIQDNHRLVYTILDDTGAPVDGQTVTLKVQKASNGYWYDFSDDSFKAAAWGSKTTNLTGDATDHLYYYVFNPPASETAADEYVFVIDNANATYKDHQSVTIAYQSIGTSTLTPALVWDEPQSGHTTNGTFGKNLDAQVSTVGGGSLTVSAIVNGILDEPLVGHTTANSTAATLSSVKDSVDGDKESGNWTGIENIIRQQR